MLDAAILHLGMSSRHNLATILTADNCGVRPIANGVRSRLPNTKLAPVIGTKLDKGNILRWHLARSRKVVVTVVKRP